MIKIHFSFFRSLLILCNTTSAQNNDNLKIWYRSPAYASVADNLTSWDDDHERLKAITLGNGSIGAMVFGNVNKERIQLNEKNLSSGSLDDSNNAAVFDSLAKTATCCFRKLKMRLH